VSLLDPVPPPPSVPPCAIPSGREWFHDEVYVHRTSLHDYVRRTFPSVSDVDDVVQESFLRLWKARARRPIDCAQAFLFRIARHVSLDLLRRRRSSPIDGTADFDEGHVITRQPTVADAASTQEKYDLLADALMALPDRRRQVVMACKFHGRKRRDVADELGITEATIDEHLAKGIAAMEQYMRDRGLDGYFGL
jgi:RNA polymerase sigma factor (sigma-70 family)